MSQVSAPANVASQDFTHFADWLYSVLSYEEAKAQLEVICSAWQQCNHGDLSTWQAALSELDRLPKPTQITIDQPVIVAQGEGLNVSQQTKIKTQLSALKPWRKGPWSYLGVSIDTEWRSDWKWERIASCVDWLDKRVLDVGCGSGYHALRMAGAGAASVVGVDPTWLFVHQFAIFKRYFPEVPVWVHPLAMEQVQMPELFDIVVSMGVLYHRRDPISHLQELKDATKRGGEMIIETLVVEGDSTTALIPEGRYAAMPNVWFIPSVAMLIRWLERLRMVDITVVDCAPTSLEEQRSTDWIFGRSLADFLDVDNPELTREGYPAPIRAVVKARKR